MTNFEEIVTAEDLNAIIKSIAPDAEIDDEYSHFLQPSYENFKRFVANHWNPTDIKYGDIKPDFPLCYDFAELAEAAIRKAAIYARWPHRPAFGVLRYTQSESRHAINFVVTSECQVKYFEPQSGEWMDQPKDLKSLDDLYI